jgi:hypothetical protein
MSENPPDLFTEFAALTKDERRREIETINNAFRAQLKPLRKRSGSCTRLPS